MTIKIFLVREIHSTKLALQDFPSMSKYVIIVHKLVEAWSAFYMSCSKCRRWLSSSVTGMHIPDVPLQITESAEVLPASCTLMHCDVHPWTLGLK